MLNLHIIGVQKAGTTALASFLHRHPSIYVVDGKEAHVFDHILYSEQSEKSAFANKIYKSKLTNYHDQPIVCDATPITVFRPEFIQACYQYNPNAKFIVVLRDPTERAVSQYYMELARSYEHRSMLTAFLLEPFRLKGINRSPCWDIGSPFRTHSYLSRGRYSKQLKSLYATVPKSQILVLQQDALKNQHKQTMHKVFEFLDLAQHAIPSKQVFVSEKQTPSSNEFLARTYARLYYLWHRETPKNWQKLIDA